MNWSKMTIMRPKRARNGSALLMALVVVMMVVALGGAYLAMSVGGAKSASASRNVDQAQHITDAALDQAKRFLFVYRDLGTWSWDDILTYNRDLPTDPLAVRDAAIQVVRNGGSGGAVASTWPEAPVPADPKVPASVPTVFGVHTVFGRGAWYLVVRNNPEEADPLVDTDRQLVIVAIATMPDGEQRAIEARAAFDPPLFSPTGAVLSNGSLKLSGSVRVTTAAGTPAADVLVNANALLEGPIDIDGKVSATGTIDIKPDNSGKLPDVRDGTLPNARRISLPDADPKDYKQYATHVFRADGVVTDGSGNPLGVGSWNGFSFGRQGWKTTGGTPPAGAYYFETDLSMSGNGTFHVTFICAGSISITGTPANHPDITPYLEGISLLAGGDIKMGGNAEVSGFVVAREQVMLRGNVKIVDGGVISLDQFDNANLVSTTSEFENTVEGNPTITYKGGQSTFLKTQVYSLRLDSVRRLK